MIAVMPLVLAPFRSLVMMRGSVIIFFLRSWQSLGPGRAHSISSVASTHNERYCKPSAVFFVREHQIHWNKDRVSIAESAAVRVLSVLILPLLPTLRDLPGTRFS